MNIPIEQCNFVADAIRADRNAVLIHCQLKSGHQGEHKPPMPASGKRPDIGQWREFKYQTKGDIPSSK